MRKHHKTGPNRSIPASPTIPLQHKTCRSALGSGYRRRIGLLAVALPVALGLSGISLCIPLQAASRPEVNDRMAPTASVENQQYAQLAINVADGKVTMDVNSVEIALVLRELARQGGFTLTDDSLIEDSSGSDIGLNIGGKKKERTDATAEKISLRLTNCPLDEALRQLCANRSIVYQYLPESRTFKVVSAHMFRSSAVKTRGAGQIFPAQASPQPSSENGVVGDSGSGGGERMEGSASAGSTSSASINGTTSLKGGNQSAQVDVQGRPLYKKGELLLRFVPDATEEEIACLHRFLGSTVIHTIDSVHIQQVRLTPGWDEEQALAAYQASGMVDHVERHGLRYVNTTTPDDPNYASAWWLENMQASDAWDISTGSKDILVAVIDTGVDFYHPDLINNIAKNEAEIPFNNRDDDNNGYIDDVFGWDMAGFDGVNADSNPMDADGHGTHVAGIMAATGNNTIGGSGLAWSAGIIPIKVEADNAETIETIHVIEAMNYALNRKARIVNCSFGGQSYSEFERSTLQTLHQAGILVICAAGNAAISTDSSPFYPASYELDNIIAVAAADSADNLASYSNYGAVSVDVLAPGSSITSTIPADPPSEATVTSADGALTLAAAPMTHAGFTDSTGLSGLLVDCDDGNQISDFPSNLSGYIAFVRRGTETFETKSHNAQDAGAGGVVIYNNVSGSFWGTLSTPGDWIPVVSISDTQGQSLSAQVGNTVTLVNQLMDDPASNYAVYSGTSMATPQVSGLAALLLAVNPELSATEVKSAIISSVDRLPALEGKLVSGGRINALSALCSITAVAGDLSGNGATGVEDAIITLRMLTGQAITCPPCVFHGVDADDNGQIGMSDALYILRELAEAED